MLLAQEPGEAVSITTLLLCMAQAGAFSAAFFFFLPPRLPAHLPRQKPGQLFCLLTLLRLSLPHLLLPATAPQAHTVFLSPLCVDLLACSLFLFKCFHFYFFSFSYFYHFFSPLFLQMDTDPSPHTQMTSLMEVCLRFWPFVPIVPEVPCTEPPNTCYTPSHRALGPGGLSLPHLEAT